MKDSCEWLNFRWALDVQYTHIDNAPLLLELCKRFGKFWDGECWYKQQSNVILRWPDWRSNYRIDMEKVRNRHRNPAQKQLELALTEVR